MIKITPNLKLDENEIQLNFIRASGPGGQNVNKVASAVQLRFDVVHSPSLPNAVRKRLRKLAGNRITNEGILVIEARQHRSQNQNRQEAINRLIDLIRKAAQKPKPRRKKKRSRAWHKERLKHKKHRSKIKKLRRPPDY